MQTLKTGLAAIALAPVFIACAISLGVVLLISKNAREKWFSERRHTSD
jgi:Ni/Fe-hydrogenase subunit HybB-like protein